MPAKGRSDAASLLPGAAVLLITVWAPILLTVYLSLQSATLVKPAEWVGLGNYQALLTDRAFLAAARNALSLALERVIVIGLVWAALKAAWAQQLRIPTGLVLFAVAPLPFITPVGAGTLWALLPRMELGPAAGLLSWSNAGRAAWSLLIVDGIHTAAVASALGLVVYALVQRSPDTPSARHPDLAAILALIRRTPAGRESGSQALRLTGHFALLIGAAGGLQSTAWSYVITGGGPANATLTPIVLFQKEAFQYLQFGHAAAANTVWLAVLLALGAVLWWVVRNLPLRLAPAPRNEAQAPGGAFRSGLLAWLSAVPALVVWLPLLWGLIELGVSTQGMQMPSAATMQAAWLNGLLAPGAAIGLIQIPLARYTAQKLRGLLAGRTNSGRWGLFFIAAPGLLCTGMITVALLYAIYRLNLFDVAGSGVPWLMGLPLLWSPAAIGLFLAVPAGSQYPGINALEAGQMPRAMWALILILGVAGIYWASQDPFWPALVVRPPDYTPGVLLLRTGRLAFARSLGFLVPNLLIAACCSVILMVLARTVITGFNLYVGTEVER